jgi:hypothetical protein
VAQRKRAASSRSFRPHSAAITRPRPQALLANSRAALRAAITEETEPTLIALQVRFAAVCAPAFSRASRPPALPSAALLHL